MLGGYYLGQSYLGISGGVGSGLLTVQNSSHAHTVDNITLIQQHTVLIDNSSHTLTSDELDLIEHKTLVIGNALHGLTSDNVTLTQEHMLEISDAIHDLASDNIVLVQSQLLVVANASHDHEADGDIILNQYLLLNQPDSGMFTVTSPELWVIQNHTLEISNTLHRLFSPAFNIFDWASHNLYAGIYIVDQEESGSLDGVETEDGETYKKQENNSGAFTPVQPETGNGYILSPLSFGNFK